MVGNLVISLLFSIGAYSHVDKSTQSSEYKSSNILMHQILESYHLESRYRLTVFDTRKIIAQACGVSDIQVSTGLIKTTSWNEFKFSIAHEAAHLTHNHMTQAYNIYQRLEATPLTLSGHTFMVWTNKLFEQQADLLGQSIYLNAKNSPSLFEGHAPDKNSFTDLDPRDGHYSFTTRWAILRSNLVNSIKHS
jgi:hypothetical protein